MTLDCTQSPIATGLFEHFGGAFFEKETPIIIRPGNNLSFHDQQHIAAKLRVTPEALGF
jgi:hypothetical protein